MNFVGVASESILWNIFGIFNKVNNYFKICIFFIVYSNSVVSFFVVSFLLSACLCIEINT